MVRTNPIDNNIIVPQQNNYNAVKIDIHNPTVNVPNTNGYAKPDFTIYQYDQKPTQVYQPPYIPKNKPEAPRLPDAQPVKELPESVIEPVKVVPVPPPVFVDVKTSSEPENVLVEPKFESEEVVKKPEDMVQPPLIEQDLKEDPQIEELGFFHPPVKPVEETSTVETPQVVSVEDRVISEPQAVEIKAPVIDLEPKAPVVKSPIEIVPPAENITPLVDYGKVSANLASENYDVQALQLKEIVDAMDPKNPEALKPYLVEQVFLDVIDIVNKDATSLAGPTEAQLQIRSKIIENYVAQLNQEKAGAKEIVYPHQISEQDINYANALAPRELAERNREYAITTLALLSKEFTNRVEVEHNTIVPITDVPGMSAIVNSLKNENFSTRLSALEALAYLQRPEYANELRPIYEALVNTDPDEAVREAAKFVLDNLIAISTPVAQAA